MNRTRSLVKGGHPMSRSDSAPRVPTAAIAAVLGGAVACAAAIAWHRRSCGVIASRRTAFGRARVIDARDDEGEPIRVLSVSGTYQSATYLGDRYAEPVFPYMRAYDHVFDDGATVRSVLMIGGGGYAYPKHLVATRPEARIDVVEVDPAITELAREYFFLDRLIADYGLAATGRLGVICADGRAFLDAHAGAHAYDAVLNDAFAGGAPVASLMTEAAARAIRDNLTDGGAYLTNVVSALAGPHADLLDGVTMTLGRVFAHVYVIPGSQDEQAVPDNNVVIATDVARNYVGAVEVRAATSARPASEAFGDAAPAANAVDGMERTRL